MGFSLFVWLVAIGQVQVAGVESPSRFAGLSTEERFGSRQEQSVQSSTSQPAPATTGQPPADYVIGPEDVLSVSFWREKDLSTEVVVRPDGMISLPLLNDVKAAGLTPDQLRQKVMADASKFVQDATVTVVVKQINSRKVYITGQVTKPGSYPLTSRTSILQLIAAAGGMLEFADTENIVIIRTDGDRSVSYKFNYKDVLKRKNLRQNIELKPGDTVVVP